MAKQKTKTMYKGIDKLVQYVAMCNTCNNAEVSNTHKTSREFVTAIRLLGWNVSGDNVVTCPKCNNETIKKGEE